MRERAAAATSGRSVYSVRAVARLGEARQDEGIRCLVIVERLADAHKLDLQQVDGGGTQLDPRAQIEADK
eukprot:2270024-Prymnesium_polylepis.1